ncbi:MAG: winged helix-turn-helix transcriptional regulator [Holophagae bacterium]|nr:winged helix-turn-helix transcriptional regulator [Holophagae bacterium]
MDKKTQIRCEELALVMKALGHPTRSFIVLELANGPRCVCKLTEMIGADISTVSKHLTVLREAGIVKSEKKGLMVFYELTSPCILNFYTCVETVVKRELSGKKQITG